jgi:hypothetical protein
MGKSHKHKWFDDDHDYFAEEDRAEELSRRRRAKLDKRRQHDDNLTVKEGDN